MQLKVGRQKEEAGAARVAVSSDKFTPSWVDKMMQLPASQRKCRYMITGEISRKICPNAYACGNCTFDQMMQERLVAETLPVHAQVQVAGFDLAEDNYYHEGHTWAKPEYGGRVRVGLDDFAQKLFGKLSNIEIPNIGHEVKQGEAGFQVRRNGDIFQVLSPISGIVTHINARIQEQPDIVNASPYEKGWLFIVEPTKLRKNLKALHYGEEAHTYMTEEKEKLFSLANDDFKIAADGGVSVEDIFEELEVENRAKFVKVFLRT
jgi:glycine cleavage system H lipoate-binding protein